MRNCLCLVLVLISAMPSIIRTSLSLCPEKLWHIPLCQCCWPCLCLCVSKEQLVCWTSEVRADRQFCCISACLLHGNISTTSRTGSSTAGDIGNVCIDAEGRQKDWKSCLWLKSGIGGMCLWHRARGRVGGGVGSQIFFFFLKPEQSSSSRLKHSVGTSWFQWSFS